jgi:hypothetical protein
MSNLFHYLADDGIYRDAVEEFLKNPNEESAQVVVRAVRRSECLPSDYNNERKEFAEQVPEFLAKLRNEDRQAWAKFLFSLKSRHEFQRFKKLSPLASQLVVAVDYGCGFVTFHGDIEPFFASIIKDTKNYLTYDGDDFLVVLPQPDTSKSEVFWVGSGTSRGANGPRPADTEVPPQPGIYEDV